MRIQARKDAYVWVRVALALTAVALAVHGFHPLHVGVLDGDPTGGGSPPS